MSWKCSSCGEEHEDPFDSCWKCGTYRAGDGRVPEWMDDQEATGTPSVMNLPCSTTQTIPGREITKIQGIVCGEAIMGANIVRDFVAGITDIVGGRSGVYEEKLREGRRIALDEMKQEALDLGANAIVGVDIKYETIGNTMMMIIASGTAVCLEWDAPETQRPA